jgi:adenylate cyclase
MRSRLAAATAVALAAASLTLLAGFAGMLDRLEGQAIDARFDLRGEREANDVAVVAIDAETFGALSRRWPFPRSDHARVVDRLRAAGVRQIAYDVQFTEPTRPREDLALYDAVARAGDVVLSTTEVDRGRTNVLGGDANLRDADARAGHTGTPADPDGVIRRVSPSVDGLDTFAVAAAESATGREVRDEALDDGRALIDFPGPPGTVPTVPFSQVLSGRFDERLLRGRVVVVGATAPSLQDVHHTSTARSVVMSGAELQASAISTALRGFPLREAPGLCGALVAVLMALLAPLASLRFRLLGIAALAAAALIAYAVAAQLLFGAGLVVPVAGPVLALALGTMGALGMRVAAEARARRRTREAFSRFVPEPVVRELVDRGETVRGLPGRRVEATVLFCDLRGFTAIAETLPAERVLEMLNRYLTTMSEAILDNGGTVVSFQGDGLMAVFGTPVEGPDHARDAFAAAKEMLGPRLAAFNAWLAERDLEPLEMGVGLNSGPVMSGTVGSDRRLEYAAVGDTTNVAARLENLTKERGGGLLMSGKTRKLLGNEPGVVPAGETSLRGRTASVALWTIAPSAVQETGPSPLEPSPVNGRGQHARATSP